MPPYSFPLLALPVLTGALIPSPYAELVAVVVAFAVALYIGFAPAARRRATRRGGRPLD